MTNAKALDERRLFRALRDQGFEVTPNGEAVKMTAPDGEPLHFHRSTFTGEHGTDANRSYRNALGELRRHGFDPDAEPSRGGTPEQVQQQREQLDEQIADESAEHAEAEAAAAAESAEAAELRERLDALTPKQRALFDAIAERPGLAPRDYAGENPTPAERGRISALGKALVAAGMIESTGATISRRWWIAGHVGDAPLPASATSGRPAAGPVRKREQAPADPLVTYKRTADRVISRSGELADLMAELIEVHEQTHAELIELRAWKRRIETRLGTVLDAL